MPRITETAVRVAPQLDVRRRAPLYAPEEKKKYYAQLVGYQRMPDPELLTIWAVNLTTPVKQIVSRAGVRVNCFGCGEEIINEREVNLGATVLCRACAGQSYYQLAEGDRAQALCNDKVKVLPRSAVKLSENDVV